MPTGCTQTLASCPSLLLAVYARTVVSEFAPVGRMAMSVSALAATSGTMAMPTGRHTVAVTGPARRSLEASYLVTRTAVSRASMRTQGRWHALFLALFSQVHGVVAGSVEGTASRAKHGPGSTTPKRRSYHAPLTGPVSSKILATATATATLSPASHGANCLAFDETKLHQAVGAYAECAQQRPSLAGAEVDAASN